MPAPTAALIALTALLACLLLPATAFGGVHEKVPSDGAWNCESCHTSDPAGEPQVFASEPVNALCLACHPEVENNAHPGMDLSFSPVRNAHPVLVLPVGTTVPDDFWLDSEGRVTCATCHDPHPETRRADLLRGDTTGTAFCRECHEGGDHRSGAFVAHARALGEGGSPDFAPDARILGHEGFSSDSEPDALSTECIACHNGTTAMEASFCVLGQEGQCTGHIIGIDYAAAAAGNAEFNTNLDPRISLNEGKIGCTSCHSIYSNLPQHLVFGNSGSALCFACHRK